MKRTLPDQRQTWYAPRKTPSILIVLALGGLLAGGVAALPEDRDKPMDITADQGTYQGGTGKMHFEGNVYLKQGTLELWADTLDVIRNPETDEVEFLEAHGQPARYQELPEVGGELIRVNGLRIEYRPDQDIIITEGNGELEQDGNVIKAHFIQYNLNDESLQVRSRRAETDSREAPQASWIIQPGALD